MSGALARPLRLRGTTRIQRNVAAHEVGKAVAGMGGVIVGHTAYSSISLAVRFELPAKWVDHLSGELAGCGIRLDDDSEAALRGFSPASDDSELVASLYLRFVHDEPDLRREVPPVPG